MRNEATTGTDSTGTDSTGSGDGASKELPPLPDHVSVGCADLPPGLRRASYFKRLRYLEIEGTRFRVPKRAVLSRWLAEIGADESSASDRRFGLVAPQEITDKPGPKGYSRSQRTWTREQLWQAGGLRDTEVIHQAVETVAAACADVRASTIIFRTPPDFVPSAHNRDMVRNFFNNIATLEKFSETVRVWEPLGLWEVTASARLAADLGVTLACDPLSNNPIDNPERLLTELPGESAYFRITGLGRGTQRFDDYALEPLLDAVHTYRRTWVVFAHAHKYPDAIRCHRLLATAADTMTAS